MVYFVSPGNSIFPPHPVRITLALYLICLATTIHRNVVAIMIDRGWVHPWTQMFISFEIEGNSLALVTYPFDVSNHSN